MTSHGILASVVDRTIQPYILHVLDELFAAYPNRNFRIQFWNGTTWGETDNPVFTLILNSPRVFQKMFGTPTELDLAEAYIFGEFDIEGNIEAAFDLSDFLLESAEKGRTPQKHSLTRMLQKTSGAGLFLVRHEPELKGTIHSKERDKQAIHYHYDLPPEFFALWLDRHLVYSCAYFAAGADADLDTAQEQKLNYICRKLRLQPGERLLDIGCGWGGLLLHAVSHYGVQGLGITLSIQQAQVARERLRNAGLQDHCRIEVCDYRDLEGEERFDKIVSVGMFEHVGQNLLPEYFRSVWRLLRSGGVFLNHGIALAFGKRHLNGPSFIDRYVFPDGELVPLHITLTAAEQTGFEVRDVENLREHYALTLKHWVRRLQVHAEEAKRITDEVTYRIWRLYMAASQHHFRLGKLNLYQVLLSKSENGHSGLPLTRADWYQTSEKTTALH